MQHDLLAPTGKSATISPCGRYRYELHRIWEPGKPVLVYWMLNPSTADGIEDDATIKVCKGRAALMGAGGISVINLFAFRATAPVDMMEESDPVGPDNDATIRRILMAEPKPLLVIAAWGGNGVHRRRDQAAVNFARQAGIALHCLGTTKDGHPKHPLRIAYSIEPQLWRAAA